jgi:ABC-type oligopeptide transport system ATPase subunit
MTHAQPLLELDCVTVEYGRGRRRPPLRAVDSASLTVQPGETVGLVGESGSGKSTIGRAVLGLVPVHSGVIRFAGRDITHVTGRERRLLGADLQVVFQDPYSSLNPARTVGQALAEPLTTHQSPSRDERTERVEAMLARVGLSPDATRRYPRHFSGGQRQRIVIARALMLSPRLVICDEAVSALDLSVQAQILNLLLELQRDLSLSYLFISHDLGVVRHVSHRIVVLHAGQIVEEGPAATVHEHPTHPYTKTLIAAELPPDPRAHAQQRRMTDTGSAHRRPSPRPDDSTQTPTLGGRGGDQTESQRHPQFESEDDVALERRVQDGKFA